MTDFSAINAAAGVTSTTTATTTTTDADDSIGQEMFLKLLVTQLQNQDPLNPDDPTEFTSQLATYSQLEQLTNLNDGMESLVDASSSSDKLSSLNTIGKEVSYKSDTVQMDGSPVTIGYSLDDNNASEVSIALVKDGHTVANLSGDEMGKGDHYLTWDGKLGNGEAVTPGEYDIKVTVTGSDGTTSKGTSLVKTEVTGVDLSGEDGGTLMTGNGEVSFNSIMGVYDQEENIASAENTAESETDDTSDEAAA